jgi:hypothetical protein
METLKLRAKMADKIFSAAESKVKFWIPVMKRNVSGVYYWLLNKIHCNLFDASYVSVI